MWHPISSALGFRHVKLTRFINACYRPSSDYANPVKAISFESLPENYKRIEFPRFLFFLQNIFVLKFFLYVFPFSWELSSTAFLNETKTILVTSVIYNAREMQNAYQIWTELAYDVFDHELFVLNSQVIRQPAAIETNWASFKPDWELSMISLLNAWDKCLKFSF